jgi:hypothetical protein
MYKKINCIFVCILLITMTPLVTGTLNVTKIKLDEKQSLGCEQVSVMENDVDDIGWYTSLALDDDGFPHISYYDYSNGDLKYAFWDGSDWNVEVVDSEGNVGRYTSIALDSNNYPHISYCDYGNGFLKYAYWDGSKWHFENVKSNTRGTVSYYTCIALDSADQPHISYCDYTKRTVNYAHWTGGSWDKLAVDSSAQMCVFEYFGDYTSIAIDSNDHPHISYCDYENYNLKYAYFTGSTWEIEVVDSEGEVGQYSSIAIDQYDNPHISYGYLQNSNLAFDLKYATKSGASWNVTTVDEEGDVRKWTSLALDATGFPHISYYDYWEGALKFAYYNGNTWVYQTVDTNGSTGCFNSLRMDSENNPCISYYDWGNKALKYASFQEEVWDVQVIEMDTNTDHLDQEQNYCCGYANPIYDDEPLAQSFIPSYKALTRVEAMIVKRYSPGGFRVSIRSDLDAEDLTSISLSSDEIAEDMSWKEFDFPDIEVTPGWTYYLVCTSENTQEENMYYWYFGIYDSYSNGNAWVYHNGWNVLTSGGFPDMDLGFKTFGLDTSLPEKPLQPSGSTSGKIHVEYTYSSSTTDPDGDQLFYLFDWGDGTQSDWVGPYTSGDTAEANHSWNKKGNYDIRVKAKDSYGAESPWSDPLPISMPKNSAIKPRFFSFLQNLLHIVQILKCLLGLY